MAVEFISRHWWHDCGCSGKARVSCWHWKTQTRPKLECLVTAAH